MRWLVGFVASLLFAAPAHAAFTHSAGNRPNGAGAAAVFKPKLKSAPTIAGIVREREVLTAADGEWERQPESFTRTWLRCNIAGEACVEVGDGTAFKLTVADVGHRMQLQVTARNQGGRTVATSALTADVVARQVVPPSASRAPSISGASTVDSVLTADKGTWLGEGNVYAMQWLRCRSLTDCTDITGATFPTYRTDGSDAGQMIRLRVTATNEDGMRSAVSAPSDTVARHSFTYVACANPDTGRGVWSGGGYPPGFDVRHDAPFGYYDAVHCEVGNAAPELSTRIASGQTTTPWTQTRWRYTVPGSLALTGGDIYRASAFTGPMGTAFTIGPDGPAYPGAWAECSHNHGCLGQGSDKTPFAETNRQGVGAQSPTGFAYTFHCHTNGQLCDGRGWHAIFGARLRLRDDASPTVSKSASGSLVSGPIGASANLTIDAQDAGSGLYRTRVYIDDVQVSAKVLGGARCTDVNGGNDNEYEFATHVPCPSTYAGTLSFDTSAWPKGEHRVHVVVEDAGRNTVSVVRRTATIG